MRVLAIVATKGGVAKTTLAAALSVEACRKGHKVAVIDLDAQRSLTRWHEMREAEAKIVGRPVLIPTTRYLDKVTEQAEEGKFDWAIVDGPPGSVATTEAAIQMADLILIPTRPSPIDAEAIDVMVQLCKRHNKEFVFLLTHTTPRSGMTTGARSYLAKSGEVLDLEIASRQAYASHMMLGSTTVDQDPKGPAAKEIAALWSEIERRGRQIKRKATR
jgi:chromosome partitioning protein